MVKTVYVADLVEGMKVEPDVFLLVEKRTGVTRTGRPYLALVVADRTGSIPVRYWNVPKGHRRVPEGGGGGAAKGHGHLVAGGAAGAGAVSRGAEGGVDGEGGLVRASA
jgi:hypothetical protein